MNGKVRIMNVRPFICISVQPNWLGFFWGKQKKSTNKFSQNQPVAKRKSVFCLWIPNKNRWYRMLLFSSMFCSLSLRELDKMFSSLPKSQKIYYIHQINRNITNEKNNNKIRIHYSNSERKCPASAFKVSSSC